MSKPAIRNARNVRRYYYMSNLQNMIISFTDKDHFNSKRESKLVGAHRNKAFVNFIKLKVYKKKYMAS